MPGVLLILIALIIVMVPQILVAFLAALLVMAGIGLLRIGHIMRRSTREDPYLDRRSREDDLFHWQFKRAPNDGRWFRFR